MSSSNKVKIPGWTFAASFQAFLTTCTVGHWKEVSTENGSEHYHVDCPLVQKLQAWGQDTEADGPRSCHAPQQRGPGSQGVHRHRGLPGPALPKGQRKWLKPNRPLPRKVHVADQPTKSVD